MKTSVIVPAYNAAATISRTLDSILRQTHAPHEVLVIDDGSTDETADVARDHPLQCTVLSQENQGQGAARNAGLKVATGEFIAFLDSDDYWAPTFLSVMGHCLLEYPHVGIASCLLLHETERGIQFLKENQETLAQGSSAPFVLEDFFGYWARFDHIRTGSVIFRRSLVAEIGTQNEGLRISQDLEYWALLGSAAPWAVVPQPLWTGASAVAARRTGWSLRYQRRRRLAPTVEAWQARILPRLDKKQIGSFKIIRGAVAANLALAHALAGNGEVARGILTNYGSELPSAPTTRLLNLGHSFGTPVWETVCLMLRFHDSLK